MVSQIRFVATVICAGIMCTSIPTVQTAVGQNAVAQAAAVPVLPADWDTRFELFQMLLENQGMEPVSEKSVAYIEPSRTAVVFAGRVPRNWSGYEITRFMQRGGAVLVATDGPLYLRGICEIRTGVGPVAARYLTDRYQEFPDCIRVKEFAADDLVASGLSEIIVNGAGWITSVNGGSGNWQFTARLPENCEPSRASRGAVIATLTRRRMEQPSLVVAADSSLFTNGMLWHAENSVLAINISKVLKGTNRNRVLFVINGRPVGSYRERIAELLKPPTPPLNDTSLPEPDLATMLRFANTLAAQVEDSNLLNELAADRPRSVSVARYRRWLWAAAAVAALGFILWRLTQPATAPQTRALPNRKQKMEASLAAERTMQSGKLHGAAQMLACGFCRELTESDNPAEWSRRISPHSSSNRLTAALNASDRKKLTMVLDLAMGVDKRHISARRLKSIGASVQELRRIHAESGGLLT